VTHDETDGDRLLVTIDEVARYIVGVDLPDLPDTQAEALVGHLTGALFVRINDMLPLGQAEASG
jgi:hypothetical protein